MYTVYWLFTLVIFLLIEIFTLGLVSVWFACGSLVACLTSILGAPLYGQILLFVAISFSLLVSIRPIAQRLLNARAKEEDVERFLGETAYVTQTIINHREQGTVRIEGSDWSARALDNEIIEEDASVVVREVQGVKLIVESVEEDG